MVKRSSSLSLIHDAKLSKSFTSARWKKLYNNPDLIFASISIGNMCDKSFLDPTYPTPSNMLSSSVYSPFSDTVGLPPHNTFFPRVLMKSIGAVFLRPHALPDANHMRGMQYQIVLNI